MSALKYTVLQIIMSYPMGMVIHKRERCACVRGRLNTEVRMASAVTVCLNWLPAGMF